MTGVNRREGGFELELTADERVLLASLAQQLDTVLGEQDDPVRERLFPDAYPGDAEASTEFRRLTRHDLLSEKSEGARVLARAVGDAETAPPRLDRIEAERVMRALADLRQVLAERLNISAQNPEPDAENELEPLYDWLGYLQECVVLALIAHDEDAGTLPRG
ncbi:DUF2017 family protein [Mycetocola spongiae]|uniref:DUF2017 family protein n=1 Tax=Mycetocola spongiae TaxID=2859226 RepID=UPI001CF38F19|nr:DUF2017 family protein [Mycetocola spongiae]UCR88268.1 DUF2017 domain-containing protein [Mycetocola spongiae]